MAPSRVSHGETALEEQATELRVIHPPSWDYPLSRQEKIQRVLLAFEKEVESCDVQVASLKAQLAATSKEQSLKRSHAAEVSRLAPMAAASPPLAPAMSEAQRVASEAASTIDRQSRSAFPETYSLLEKTSEETFTLFEQASRQVVEDTRQTTEALQRLPTAMDEMLSESAEVVIAAHRDVKKAMEDKVGEWSKVQEELTEAWEGRYKGVIQETKADLQEQLRTWGWGMQGMDTRLSGWLDSLDSASSSDSGTAKKKA